MSKVLIINGPNLNLTGKREPEIYGFTDFEAMLDSLKKKFAAHTIEYFQSNVEGELISCLQEADGKFDGVLLNAGGYTHTSIALADTIAAIAVPVVEIHLSNIFSREDYRHVSFLGRQCKGSITGFGAKGYELGIRFFVGD